MNGHEELWEVLARKWTKPMQQLKLNEGSYLVQTQRQQLCRAKTSPEQQRSIRTEIQGWLRGEGAGRMSGLYQELLEVQSLETERQERDRGINIAANMVGYIMDQLRMRAYREDLSGPSSGPAWTQEEITEAICEKEEGEETEEAEDLGANFLGLMTCLMIWGLKSTNIQVMEENHLPTQCRSIFPKITLSPQTVRSWQQEEVPEQPEATELTSTDHEGRTEQISDWFSLFVSILDILSRICRTCGPYKLNVMKPNPDTVAPRNPTLYCIRRQQRLTCRTNPGEGDTGLQIWLTEQKNIRRIHNSNPVRSDPLKEKSSTRRAGNHHQGQDPSPEGKNGPQTNLGQAGEGVLKSQDSEPRQDGVLASYGGDPGREVNIPGNEQAPTAPQKSQPGVGGRSPFPQQDPHQPPNEERSSSTEPPRVPVPEDKTNSTPEEGDIKYPPQQYNNPTSQGTGPLIGGIVGVTILGGLALYGWRRVYRAKGRSNMSYRLGYTINRELAFRTPTL
ncbi:hypothetical protein C922_05221 [Plasmodium inui San Antonio 1]|uniref:Uncharacterized protein n=1 Tax=Plasmodium inui San Antonio 1 TaxID=1237626 RepID=W6ZYN4_9APIC|nr:hypothetical protein C922_05221 [Plasmodium inui San Antonio 1]EUD64400.1 hypothetical protein C922_05221 [Plasmodium inui San Antonio 1]